MLSGVLKERRPVSEPFIALLAGVLIGPAVLGLLDLAELGNEMVILEEVTLVTPGIALVGVALRLPVVVLMTILPTLVAQRWFAPDHQEEAAADR
jgi:NhaP-type Na+/H+ or K+/H+ antiporter